ncbi:MAG: ParB/RepB/Spo0J family partition protein [Syntrophothermaceae bacterium]
MAKRGLGRGLDALLAVESNDGQAREVLVNQVRARGDQPRREFAEDKLEELAASILEHGVLQPILVRPLSNDEYELIAGERRLRAAQMAGLEVIPAVVREMDEQEAAEAALIENLQREDLNPVEEALAYRHMLESYGYTQEILARRIGKSRSHIANSMRILSLPAEIIRMLEERQMSAGHARAILAVQDDNKRLTMAKGIVEQGLSVREAEKAAKAVKSRKGRAAPARPPEILELEERLEGRLGTRVKLKKKRRGGKLEIFFYDNEDLQRVLDILDI